MRKLLLITFLICAGNCGLNAQSNTRFLEAMAHYEAADSAKFSYDPAVFALFEKNFDTNKEFSQFISDVQSQLPVRIQKVGEDYYTAVIIESEYYITLTDSLANTAIAPPFFVLINSIPTDTKIDSGAASFLYKPTLSDTLIVYAPGYEKKLLSVESLLNNKTLSVNLMTQTYFLNDVLVEDYVTKGINMDPASQKITIEVKDLPLLPGETDGDIFASLAALPGITTPDGRPGNLFIRGNSIDQSLVLFDNIPMYHRGHYFGTISPYNPKVVSDVEVHRSGYHPRMGGRVGGAVFIHSDEPVSNQPRYGIGMNTLYVTAYGKTPLANNKIGLTFGARHSYPSSIKSPKLNAITESVFAATGIAEEDGSIGTDVNVKFQDYHAKLIVQPNDKNKISISGIYSNSDLSYKLITGPVTDQVEGINFENYGMNSDWQYQINNKWSATWTNTIGNYTYTSGSPTPTGESNAENKVTDYNGRLEISTSKQLTHEIQIGIDYKWQATALDYNNIANVGNQSVLRNEEITAHTFSPYANLSWYGEKYNVQLGLRSSFYSPKQSFYLSPRLSANYTVNSWLNLKASAGRYHQFLSQVKNLQIGVGGFDNALWQLASADEGNVISGTQFMTGFMLNQNNWLFDAEVFYKTANNITYYENLFLDNRSGYFTADNLLYGIDTYIKRGIGEHGSVWLGYSYGGSKIELDTTNQTSYKSKYVQPHLFYIGTAYQKDRWKFSAVWKYGSGLNARSLEIAYVQVIYERAQANLPPGVPRQPDPFEDVQDRYPKVHSLDVSASYKIPYNDDRPWSASFGLSVINLYNRDNLIDRAFRGNPPPPRWIDRKALGFAPNLMVLIEW